ncbi:MULTISPECIES: type Z 30S ribosomal protein S14 [Solidesulfovibrio]|uniref:type Z 30S ribosomal protein S14 n=1 Tax=Solidesulfovibrio TaxID=2910984 RepID=UPI000A022115|nr:MULTISPECIES: type Z 30S ribosomal protein S14 [Solidesulfovibrio]MEA5090358.1 type Z 30S ribosomal protein S14 [Solidesulfovibrio sp.]HCR11862.1 type Z 30S ribosomal protein S14 [Desulfovibrio sp.]HML60395.1 type Z 30S ribosomal protein S14 [Solidesulfovibrio sp.]
MARKSLMVKASRKPKFSTRAYNRCPICGRPRAFLRKFGVCRICFRNMSLTGEMPGVRKSSW